MKFIKSVIAWIQIFMKKLKSDRVDVYSAQSAFYIVMGFIPFIMLLLSMIQFTPLTQDDMLKVLMNILPEGFREFVEGLVSSLYMKSSGLISGTVIAAVWACARSVLSITNGLNSIHGLNETRNYVIMRFRSAIYIVALIIAIGLSMALLVFGNQLHVFLVNHVSFFSKISNMLIVMRTLVTILILSIIFTAMYIVLPNEKPKLRTQIPGAVLAALAWCIYSYGFSIYFEHYRNNVTIYGSLTSVVMIMLWLYFCMYLVFLGAEFNCYLEDPQKFSLTDNHDMLK